MAALSFTAEVDHDFALEGNARFGEEACYAFLLFLLPLLATGCVDGALVPLQVATQRESGATLFIIAHVGLFT